MNCVPTTGLQECRVYERLAVSGAGGDLLRPGGMVLTERAVALCGFHPGSHLLDVGCGTGGTVEHLGSRYGFRTVGVDPSYVMINQGLARNKGMKLVLAQGERLPFPDALFEGAFAECSLSLAQYPEHALMECHRVLRTGGKLILSDIYLRSEETAPEMRSLGLHCCLTGAPSRHEILQRLQRCGFTVVSWQDHSPALKVFAAQLMLSQESAQPFWCSLTGASPEEAGRIEEVVSRARPGYFLIIAVKVTK